MTFEPSEEISISDEGPVLGRGWIHLVSFVILLAGVYLGYRVLKTDARIGAAIIAGSVIPAAITVVQMVRLRRALGEAKLLMRDDRVPLGWNGTVKYIRPLRRGATVRSIEARLQCEEKVVKGTGKNQKEWHAIVVDEPLSVETAPMLEQLHVTIPIKIPAAGPPTFVYTDNEITWWVRLHLQMDGCPDARSWFRIGVAPAAVGQ